MEKSKALRLTESGGMAVGVPLEISDRWHLGGITKSITSTMIARLIESGQMQWTGHCWRRFSRIGDSRRLEKGNTETVAYGHRRCAGAVLTGTLDEADSRRSCTHQSEAASCIGDHRRKTNLPARQKECVLQCRVHDSWGDGRKGNRDHLGTSSDTRSIRTVRA